jgi:hypothetical protein
MTLAQSRKNSPSNPATRLRNEVGGPGNQDGCEEGLSAIVRLGPAPRGLYTKTQNSEESTTNRAKNR